MRTVFLFIIIAVFAFLSVAATGDPTVTIYTDADTYQSGDTIEVSLSAQNYGDSMSVAVYVGLLTPDGWIYAFGPGGWSGLLQPWIPDIYVWSPFSMAPTPLWWLDLPCTMPPISDEGLYNFAALLTYAGTFDWASELSLAPFTVEGAGDIPIAYIDAITPNPATQGEDTVQFMGHGIDTDGTIAAYEWSSDLDGVLSTNEDFSMEASELTAGIHAVSYRVQDNDGAWSEPASEALVVEAQNIAPSAHIDSITPNPARQGEDTVQFMGHGNDTDGTIEAYEWSSDLDGVLTTKGCFSMDASELTVGTHTIYYKVWDNDGAASLEVSEELTINPTGSLDMVSIPAGSFLMGSPSDETGHDSGEGPQRTVNISAFKMSQTQVTQMQWEDIMGWNDSSFIGDERPVECVTWFDCLRFCNELSQVDGLTKYYTITDIEWDGNHIEDAYVKCDFDADGYRLPTEAEWEYACRAGTTTRFYTGDSDSDLGRAGWYSGNSSATTHPVGEKEPNAFGLFDMHGNVWEWCWDWYDDDYYGTRPDPDSDPTGPGSGSNRVLRGSSWCNDAGFCRSAARGRISAGSRSYYFGFRVCRSSD